MGLDTETVFLLHFKAEIWQEGEFHGGHFEFHLWNSVETSLPTNKLDHFQLGIHMPNHTLWALHKSQVLHISKISYLLNKVVYISFIDLNSPYPKISFWDHAMILPGWTHHLVH